MRKKKRWGNCTEIRERVRRRLKIKEICLWLDPYK